MRNAFIVLMAVVATGCVYRVRDIPNVAETSFSPKRIYILRGSDSGNDRASGDAPRDGWQRAAAFAADLERAGFQPIVVQNLDSVQPGEVVVDEAPAQGRCRTGRGVRVRLFGVIPSIECKRFGHDFKVSKAGEAAGKDVTASYTVKVVTGWLTWPIAWSGAYANGTPHDKSAVEDATKKLLRGELSSALASSAAGSN